MRVQPCVGSYRSRLASQSGLGQICNMNEYGCRSSHATPASAWDPLPTARSVRSSNTEIISLTLSLLASELCPKRSSSSDVVMCLHGTSSAFRNEITSSTNICGDRLYPTSVLLYDDVLSSSLNALRQSWRRRLSTTRRRRSMPSFWWRP